MSQLEITDFQNGRQAWLYLQSVYLHSYIQVHPLNEEYNLLIVLLNC